MKKSRFLVSGPWFTDGIWYVYKRSDRFGLQTPWKLSFATRAEARAYIKKKNRRTKLRRQAHRGGR